MTRRASSGEKTALELSDRLLAEAVRAFEQDGSNPLRDRTAEAVGRRAGGDFEHRIVTRARSLGAAEQFADALRRVRQMTGLVVMLGTVFALVAGAATVRAALGDERAGSVNIYWVIGGVLGDLPDSGLQLSGHRPYDPDSGKARAFPFGRGPDHRRHELA